MKDIEKQKSADDEIGKSDLPSITSDTDDFWDNPISDNSDANQSAKEGWICVKDSCQPLVAGDEIQFYETAFDRSKYWKKGSNGFRLNVARIVRMNYDKKGKGKVHFEVIESTGDTPLLSGKKYHRFHRNITRWKCYRKPWDDETQRQTLVEENNRQYERISKERDEQEKADLEDILSGHDSGISANNSEDSEEKRQQTDYIMSEAEKIWVADGWLKEADAQCLNNYKPEEGWKQMSNTNDCVVEGDIIRFIYIVYDGKYPKGKKSGHSIIIAKVKKVARKYYHLQFIASKGPAPYISDNKQTFCKKFDTVAYWPFYRLWWNCELVRADKLGKRLKMKFNSESEYDEYIQQPAAESSSEDKKQEIPNNQENNNIIEKENVMQKVFDFKKWLKEQELIKGEVSVKGGNYYKWSGHKSPVSILISNFALKVEAKIVQDGQWWFVCSVINNNGIINKKLILSRDDLQSAGAFKRALALDSRIEYYGDAKDTTHIQGLLNKQKPPLKHGTDELGIHRINDRWVYVEGDNVVDHNGAVDDIVFTKTNLKQDDLPTLLQQMDITEDELKAIADNLNKFNEPSIVYPLLGWVGFCFLKDRLAYKVNSRNPILFCHGEPGVGKTETISHVVQRIFCSKKPSSNIGDMTKFTLAANGCRSNFTPTCYDEWKPWVMTKQRVKDLESVMLATFNKTSLPRGTAEQTVNEYRFTSPLAILGEMTIESVSLKHRMIELFFNYKGRSSSEAHFKQLCQLPLEAFGKGLLLHMLSISDSQLDKIFDKQRASVDTSIDGRFADNATLARMGLWLILDYLNVKGIITDDYTVGYDCIDKVIKESLNAARVTNVEKIIRDLSVMSHTRNCSGNWLIKGYHYEIRDGKVYIKIAEAYEAYRRYAKTNDISSEMINKSSFLQQLQTKPYFLGKKTYRIGDSPANGICLSLQAIPAYAEIDFAV
ncbi:MAG: hypothetical protein ACYC3B_03000 [Sedimentisphaerales bacterium]